MANPIEDAFALASAIVKYQKQQRAQPYVSELQRVGSQWAGADPQQRERLNAQNNAIRNAYLQSGGSVIDIPEALRGSNPAQGFQIGQKQFVPGYFGDNLSRGQKIKDAGLTGMYENRPTMDYQDKMVQNQYKQANLGIQQEKLALSKSNVRTSTTNKTNDKYSSNINKANNYFDKLSTTNVIDKYGHTVQKGVGLKTKAALKNQFKQALNEYLADPDPYGSFQNEKQAIYNKYPDTGGYLVNALENALSQISNNTGK